VRCPWLAVLGLLLAATTSAWAGDDETSPSRDPVADLEARWLKDPGDVGLGIRLQDAMRAEGLATRAQTLFRRESEKRRDDLAVQFLYGRVRADEEGLALMRAAWSQDLGGTASGSNGMLSASIALAVAEVDGGHGADAASAALRVTSLRGDAEDWVYLGWIQHRLLGDRAAAIESYTRALRARQDHLGARSALITLLLDEGKASEALALAKVGVEQHAQSSAAHLHLGLALAATKDAPAAAEAFERAYAGADGDADALAAVGSAFLDSGRRDRAQEALEQALKADPKHGHALTTAGRLAMQEDRLKEARKLLARAAAVRPKSARVAFLQGVCAQRLGLHTSAVSSFGRAVSLDPERVEYVTALGLAHVEKGSLASAIVMLRRAVELAPQDPELRMQLGIACMKNRAHKDARDAFLEAVDRDAQNPRPHFYLAVIQGDKLGKSREALDELRRYVALGGKEPTALSWLAQLEKQLGER